MMFERMANGWKIAVSSWRVLMTDKELVVFPILSGAACLLVLASFAAPILASPELQHQLQAKDAKQNPVFVAAGLLFYIVNFFVIVFFNSALVSCALIRFAGGDPTVGDGLRAATARLPQIMLWALVAGTVGWILRAIEERVEMVGKLVVGLIGAGWTVATFFVIPVLVVEKASPIDAIKRSSKIMMQTWGEAIIARASMGLFILLLMLPGIAILIGGTVLLANNMPWPGGFTIGAGLLWLLSAGAVGAALQGIYMAALYTYAAKGQIPSAYESGVLKSAFGPKAARA